VDTNSRAQLLLQLFGSVHVDASRRYDRSIARLRAWENDRHRVRRDPYGDDAAKLTVVDNAELSGYEAELEGRRVGFIAYDGGTTRWSCSTRVDPRSRAGIASAMATAAFDDVRARD